MYPTMPQGGMSGYLGLVTPDDIADFKARVATLKTETEGYFKKPSDLIALVKAGKITTNEAVNTLALLDYALGSKIAALDKMQEKILKEGSVTVVVGQKDVIYIPTPDGKEVVFDPKIHLNINRYPGAFTRSEPVYGKRSAKDALKETDTAHDIAKAKDYFKDGHAAVAKAVGEQNAVYVNKGWPLTKKGKEFIARAEKDFTEKTATVADYGRVFDNWNDILREELMAISAKAKADKFVGRPGVIPPSRSPYATWQPTPERRTITPQAQGRAFAPAYGAREIVSQSLWTPGKLVITPGHPGYSSGSIAEPYRAPPTPYRAGASVIGAPQTQGQGWFFDPRTSEIYLQQGYPLPAQYPEYTQFKRQAYLSGAWWSVFGKAVTSVTPYVTPGFSYEPPTVRVPTIQYPPSSTVTMTQMPPPTQHASPGSYYSVSR